MYRNGREFLDPVLILAVIARVEDVINRLFFNRLSTTHDRQVS
jgi:hypothetical protein